MSGLRAAAAAVAVSLAAGLSGCAALEEQVRQVGEDIRQELSKPDAIPADAPFAGSPAEKFGHGATAIVAPDPKPKGRFSAEDVAYAYRITKKILASAYLHKPTLMGGKPTAFARALDPEQRKIFLKGLDHKNQKKNTRGWVASFAPGEAELVGDVIKVDGSMSARQGKDQNGDPELWVNFEYRFVYAVRKPGTDKITRVMAYDKGQMEFWRDAPGQRLRHWVGDSTDSWVAGVECRWDDGFLYPSYPGEADAGESGKGPVQDPYADSTPMGEQECANVSDI